MICGPTSLSSPGGAGTTTVSSLPDLTFMLAILTSIRNKLHLPAVAPRCVLMEINRCIGQIPDAIPVAVALPHEVGIFRDVLAAQIGIEFCAGDASTSVGNAMGLDLAIDAR